MARFLCRENGKTFSLLPIQLIPYFQYTVPAVIGALLLGLKSRESGQQGFYGAAAGVDPDSLVTPWLVAYCLIVVIKGLRNAQATLVKWYDLSGIHSGKKHEAYEEASGYFSGLGWKQEVIRGALMALAFTRDSQRTKLFLFGKVQEALNSKQNGNGNHHHGGNGQTKPNGKTGTEAQEVGHG